MGEAWSPTAVRGFRVWRIQDNQVMGNQIHWAAPTLVRECLYPAVTPVIVEAAEAEVLVDSSPTTA